MIKALWRDALNTIANIDEDKLTSLAFTVKALVLNNSCSETAGWG